MKKILTVLLLVSIALTGAFAAGSQEGAGSSDNWKIGIFTGTVTQNEEEYRAAENVLAKYGEEHVIIQTYPDKFMDEQETVIANPDR